MRQIFECSTHFEYLTERFAKRAGTHGLKTRFSTALRIQPAFLSQVLARKYALSLEQADLANQFFDHSDEEAEFFLLLVSRDRAGTPSLLRHFDRQIQATLKKRMQVIERLGRRAEISEETKGIYFSSWIYSAVHVCCTVVRLRTRKAIAKELALPVATVGRVLEFLRENDLVRHENDAWVPTQNWVSISKESPHIVKHHMNWRQKAVQNLEVQTDEDLHYSGMFSIDAQTALRVKDRLLEYLKEQHAEFEKAKEEYLFVVGVDFFRMVKPRGE